MDDQVTIDPEFNPQPDGSRDRWRWLIAGAAVAIAAFLFGWLLGSDTSGESDGVEAAPSTASAPRVETTAATASPSTTTTTVSVSTTASPTTASTTEPPDPLASELLQPGDHPAAFGWAQVPDDDEAYWDRDLVAGPTVLFCSDPTLVLSDAPWKLTATSPLIELRDGPVAAAGGISLQQALYGDDEANISIAFDTLVAELEGCLATYDPTFLWVPEYVEDGWRWVADRYDLPPTGDASYAIGYSAQHGDTPPDGSEPDMRLAIVHSGERITVIFEGSHIAGSLTNSEFNEIVEVAANRLAS